MLIEDFYNPSNKTLTKERFNLNQINEDNARISLHLQGKLSWCSIFSYEFACDSKDNDLALLFLVTHSEFS